MIQETEFYQLKKEIDVWIKEINTRIINLEKYVSDIDNNVEHNYQVYHSLESEIKSMRRDIERLYLFSYIRKDIESIKEKIAGLRRGA